jgi:hypothetical protein
LESLKKSLQQFSAASRSAVTEAPEFICVKDNDDTKVVCSDGDDEDDWSRKTGGEVDEFPL